MKKKYILDACALTAFVAKEPGGDIIFNLICDAKNEICQLRINQVNLFEVYYFMMKNFDRNKANQVLRDMESTPIEVTHEMSDDVMKEAGRLKITYDLSIGDAIAAAESAVANETLVTADRKDFDRLKREKKIKTLWFR